MARLDITAQPGFKRWLSEDFGGNNVAGGSPHALIELQSASKHTKCNVQVGQHIIRSSKDAELRFVIDTNPLAPRLKLQLLLSPLPPNPTAKDRENSNKYRLEATFSAYVEGSAHQKRPEYIKRKGSEFKLPTEEYSFSTHVQNLKLRYRDNTGTSTLPFFEDLERRLQPVFSWRSQTFLSTGCPTDELSDPAKAAAALFKKIVGAAIDPIQTHDERKIRVVCRPLPILENELFPFFVSMPTRTPPSWLAWIMPVDSDDVYSAMVFPPVGTFEVDSSYINMALGTRDGGWIKQLPNTDLKAGMDGKPLVKLYPKTRFVDEREYLAHVLGTYAYEDEHGRKATATHYNGMHRCEVVRGRQDPTKFLVALNIRPPKLDGAADLAALPATGERVHITLSFGNDKVVLHGRVVKMPQPWRKYGRNVAIVAFKTGSTPTGGHIVQDVSTLMGSFHFGHYGTTTTPTYERIMSLMLNATLQFSKAPDVASWIKTLLLSRNNHDLAGNDYGMVSRIKTVVDKVCTDRKLNTDQTRAVNGFFSQRVTLVRGPPGTGKSTLIDAILDIQHRLGESVWVCTESNTACDVLVRKAVMRLGSLQENRGREAHPRGYFRIKPAFEEQLNLRSDSTDIDPLSLPSTTSSVTEEVAAFLEKEENVQRVMSLEYTIKDRMNLYAIDQAKPPHARGLTPLYSGGKNDERKDIAALQKALTSYVEFKRTESGDDSEEEEVRLDNKLRQALLRVQQQYVKHFRVRFSTAAAASGVLLRFMSAQAMIMDEASQLLEARAVSAICHAISGGTLQRILLIGDDQQLPPTLLASRNPFSRTGEVSLFERLINSGLEPVTLRVQFRMHPTISSVCQTTIYKPLDGTGIIDDKSTAEQPGAAEFQKFIQGFAKKHSNVPFPAKTNAAVVAPVSDDEYGKDKCGLKTYKQVGSTSRFNLLTARVVMRLVTEIVTTSPFKAKDILIIAFYADQVALLRALFDPSIQQFKDIRIETVDGSQGSEREIVIVDCVTMGHGAQDTMGFLNADRRRFNVAMSRAKVGRITIVRDDFIKVQNHKEVNAGPWNEFFNEARKRKTIIPGTNLNSLTDRAMKDKFDEVRKLWQAALTADEKTLNHRNIGDPTVKDLILYSDRTRSAKRDDIMTFVEQTGASRADAEKYLGNATGAMHIAINKYFHDHPNDEPVVDI